MKGSNSGPQFGPHMRSIFRRVPLGTRLASLVGITQRETGVGKLGWHGNSTGFDGKNTN